MALRLGSLEVPGPDASTHDLVEIADLLAVGFTLPGPSTHEDRESAGQFAILRDETQISQIDAQG
jgi:hypothetical protein